MLENIQICFKNILRKRLRTILTSLAVSIGVCSVIVVSSAGDMGTDMVNRELDSLGLDGIVVTCSNQSGKSDKLTDSELKVIDGCKGISAAMPVSVSVSSINVKGENQECLLWGIDEKAGDIVSLKVLHGRMFEKSDIISKNPVCLVDSSVANSAYERTNIVGKKINLNVGGILKEYTVVGVVDAESSIFQNVISDYVSSFIYVPVSQVSESYDRIAVKIKESGDIKSVGTDIENSLNRENSQFVYEAKNLASQRNALNSILKTVTFVLSAIGAISLFVAGITILTAMTMSVNEQTREIGIKKAIGASNARIMGEVIFEAVVISLIGSSIGALSAVLIVYGVCGYFGLSAAPIFGKIAGALVFSVAVSILFSFFPAFKAARLNPVESLRRD